MFDYADTTTVMVSLPGLMAGEPNLRTDALLRHDFILRDMTSSGLKEMTYSVQLYCNDQSAFQLPATILYDSVEYGPIDFPVLPVMKNISTIADVSDVQVSVDGTASFLIYLDASSGQAIIDSSALAGSLVEFSYKVGNYRQMTVSDPYDARVFDSDYVFGGFCPDPDLIDMTTSVSEYVNYLEDYSSGIKKRYFNKTSWALEERVFSGPVFEMCDSNDDEIGSSESFPGALVSVPWGVSSEPMSRPSSLNFLSDEMVRFRKKTVKELLPDRSFRSLEIREMTPI
jgi:hypothetical protein